jgi:hypothetical protein
MLYLCGLRREEFEGESGFPFLPRLGELLGDVHGDGLTNGEEREKKGKFNSAGSQLGVQYRKYAPRDELRAGFARMRRTAVF